MLVRNLAALIPDGNLMNPELRINYNSDSVTYDAYVGDEVAGALVLERAGTRMILTHVTVSPEHQHQGIGGHLVQAALDEADENGLTVTPLCPFAVEYIADHKEFERLVDVDHPGRYRISRS
jgi:predicted GNAT family acetyltransferase